MTLNSRLPENLRFCILKIFLILTVAGLQGCAALNPFSSQKDKDPVIEGERISVMALEEKIRPENPGQQTPFEAPRVWRNSFWPQAGGYPSHAMLHLDLGPDIARVWKSSLGAGQTKRRTLTAAPIVVDERIFAIDAQLTVSAFETEKGGRLWRQNVAPENKPGKVRGPAGGLSFYDGLIYVTNGYAELLALDPQNGEIRWRRNLPAPSRAAPTIANGRIFIVTLDNRTLALDAENGQQLWEHQGFSESTALVGSASAAATRDIVISPYSSGEVYSLIPENGAVAWSEDLGAAKASGSLAGLADIQGHPVIDAGAVYAMSFAGRLVAIDLRQGERIWQKDVGGLNTPWPAGNRIFILTSDNEAVALNRNDGSVVWVTKLPSFGNVKKRKNPVQWYGPLFAGGRLWYAGSNKILVALDPESGKRVTRHKTGIEAVMPPIVADRTLYLVGADGKLMAFRSKDES